MSKLNVGVGEARSQQPIHVVVVTENVQVPPQHLDGVEFGGIHLLEVMFGRQNHIDHNVLIGVRLLTLVHHAEHIQVPNGRPVVVIGPVERHGGENARLRKLRKHHFVQIVASQHVSLEEVRVGTLEHVSQTDVNPAILSINIGQLFLKEVKCGCIVVQTSLDKKSFGEPSEPILVQLGI